MDIMTIVRKDPIVPEGKPNEAIKLHFWHNNQFYNRLQ